MAPFDATLEAARQGEEWAWSRLYADYAPKVLGYLRARNAPDPEDLLGEVFLQLVRDLTRFAGGESDFRSWLFTVTHHRMLDGFRAQTRRKAALTDEILAREPLGNTEDEALDSLRDDEIRRVLDGLSEDQRTVLLLRIFAGMSAPQIAETTERSVGAVKALLHRGSAAIRRELARGSVLLDAGAAMSGERA
jgi:RNA polymerase sigma factor (sigma-70 family)